MVSFLSCVSHMHVYDGSCVISPSPKPHVFIGRALEQDRIMRQSGQRGGSLECDAVYTAPLSVFPLALCLLAGMLWSAFPSCAPLLCQPAFGPALIAMGKKMWVKMNLPCFRLCVAGIGPKPQNQWLKTMLVCLECHNRIYWTRWLLQNRIYFF